MSIGVVLFGLILVVGMMAHAAGDRKSGPPISTQPAGEPDPRATSRVLSPTGYDITTLSPQRVEELAQHLSEEERHILLRKGTERPFCGLLVDNKEPGTYTCRLCGLPLFSSDAKFQSHSGWPSFFQPVDRAHIHEESDLSHGMIRTEIMCARCRAHLGHVFDDGPRPTGLRYCLNSGSLSFHKRSDPLPAESLPVRH